jgi:Zn-dependent peptidase ImmA (M78 family)/DNA-binding XRE family transcriptional regulator
MNEVIEKIRKLRIDSKLTQDELGKELGMSRDSILRLENGKQDITLPQLEKFAKFFDVPLNEFFPSSNQSQSEGFTYMLRCDSNQEFVENPKLKENFEKAYLRIEKLAERIKFQIPESILPIMPQREYNTAGAKLEGRKAANELRRLWDLGQDPIDDPVKLLENRGFFIMEADLGQTTDKHAVFAISGRPDKSSRPAIMLNNNEAIKYERKRFTLMHELGHWLAHRDNFMETPPSGGRGRGRDPREVFADAFAANFLVPGEGLRRMIDKFKKSETSNQSIIVFLKHYFKVSYLVIIMRLIEEKYLEPTYGNALIGKNKKKYGIDEPLPLKGDLSFEQELNMIAWGLEQKKISITDLEKMKYCPNTIEKAKERIDWMEIN